MSKANYIFFTVHQFATQMMHGGVVANLAWLANQN